MANDIFLVLDQIRGKKVKAKGSTRNAPRHTRPKHRGWKVQDGSYVSENKVLVMQRELRFHPGLNVKNCYSVDLFVLNGKFILFSNQFQVGFGKNGTLFALQPGRVIVTCEPINPNWDHTWIQRIYAGREDETIYKKHFNVLPLEQHNRFKLIDEI